MMKLMLAVVLLGAAPVGGCGSCTADRRTETCDGPNESFDSYGVCCNDLQQTKENGERICDPTIQITDAGTLALCPSDKVAVCLARTTDGGEPSDGGDASDVDGGDCTTLVVCPAGRELTADGFDCIDPNAVDAGTPVCPDPPDAGDPCQPGERLACVSTSTQDGGSSDGSTCTTTVVTVNCGVDQIYNAATAHCDDLDPLVCPDPPDAGSCPVLDGGACPTCPVRCPASQTLNGAGTRCMDTVRTCGDDFTAHCGTGHDTWLMDDQCACSPEPAPCDICPTPIVCKTCNGVGEYLNTKTNPPSCVTPPVPPGPCPTNETRGNDGLCAPQLAPTLEAAFLVSPSLAAPAIASPSQTNVSFGTLVLRGPAGKTVEANGLKLTVLVADNPTGTYTVGLSGSVRAMDRFSGCKLKDWPPLTGSFGPVAFGADGKSTAFGLISFQGMRAFDLQCDLTSTLTNGDADGFAMDPDSLQATTVETNGSRTSIASVVTNHNGPPPLLSVTVGCGYVVTASTGTARVVRTKPTFSLSPSSPTGKQGAAHFSDQIYQMHIVVPNCAAVTLMSFPVSFVYTDRNTTNWADKLYSQSVANIRMSKGGDLSTGVGSLQATSRQGNTLTFNAVFSSGGLVIPAGSTYDISIWIDSSGASLNDQIQVQPGTIAAWTGDDNPSGYPASIQAPDLAAAVGNVITF